MNIPEFTAQASLYRTSNRYRSSVAEFAGSIADHSVVAAYIPGPRTQERCSGCTDICVGARNICLAGVGVSVLSACGLSLGFGCAGAYAWGAVQTAGCYAHYAECFGYCQIPSASEVGWESPCCPKVCGIHTPGSAGSGCCDHGEACVGSHNPNTRDGCCPVGQECHGNCCAKGEYCLDGGICSTEPGYFENSYPPPHERRGTSRDPRIFADCGVGQTPCGAKCCPPGLKCCYDVWPYSGVCRDTCGPR